MPMTARAIAEKVAQDHRLDAGTTEAMHKLVSEARNALASHKAALASERKGEAVLRCVK